MRLRQFSPVRLSFQSHMINFRVLITFPAVKWSYLLVGLYLSINQVWICLNITKLMTRRDKKSWTKCICVMFLHRKRWCLVISGSTKRYEAWLWTKLNIGSWKEERAGSVEVFSIQTAYPGDNIRAMLSLCTLTRHFADSSSISDDSTSHR